jgi:hypothetical protein
MSSEVRIWQQMGEFMALDLETLPRFLLGLPVHLKNGGAVVHPALDGLIEDFGNPPWPPTSKVSRHKAGD